MIESLIDRITRASLRFKWVTIILSVLLLAAGVLAITQLNQELLPKIEYPQTVVLGLNPGTEADVMLNEVTIPLEERVREIQGVVNVESTTSGGASFLIIRNEFGEDLEEVRDEIRAAVESVDYPDDMDTPELLTFSFSDLPIASLSASSADLTLEELKALVEAEVVPELEAVPQVADVQVSGGQALPDEVVAQATEEETPAPTPEPTATPTEEPTATPTTEPTATATPTLEPTATITATSPAGAGGDQPDPVSLPDSWVQAAASQGVEIATTADLTPELVGAVAQLAPDLLQDLTPEMLLAMPLESLQALPETYLAGLDPELQAQLAERAASTDAGEEEMAEPEPVALPDAWVQAAASQGVEIATTADLTPELVGAVAQLAPDLLQDLTPEMLLAMPADVLAVLPEDYLAGLDAELQAQLAERMATPDEGGATPEPAADVEPVPLPESWVQAAATQGITLTTTADLTPQLVGGIAQLAPDLLQDLTPEMLLAMPADVLAALPQEYLETLEPEVQAQVEERMAAAPEGEPTEEPEATPAGPTATPDPARLPDVLVEGASQFGVELETAQDITPDLMRQLTSVPQAVQFLRLLTPDNLRNLPPESIALLPPAFVDELEPDLQAELDEIASEFGGAGALAQAEADEQAAAEEAAGEAPPLPEPWSRPDEDGNVVFEDAGDILFNDFGLSGAQLLNQIPNSPNVQNPAEWMGALTPEIIQYLAENEEAFAANLSPTIVELFPPASITYLLDNYPDAFDAALTERLQSVAAGEVDVFVPESTITRVDGNPSLNLNVFKDGEANTVAVSEDVFEKLDELEAAHPGLSFDIAFEQSSFIEESVSGVAREGTLGAVFAVIVILIFLSGRTEKGNFVWSWRSTLVTGVSIPLSVLMAFALLKWLPPALSPVLDPLVRATEGIPVLGGIMVGIRRLFPINATLNIMTLSGMTVAIGRVVDDSIVVLENIYRHIQRGDEQRQAVLMGTRDVAIAILASTITTVIVFLPIGLAGGIIGEFFLPFGVTVTYALLSSFLVAVTIVPLLAFLFIRSEHLPPEGETPLQRRYTPILRWALDHRIVTILIATVIFLGSLFLLAQRPQAFLPELGEVQITTTVNLPAGTGMVQTNAQVEEFETAIADVEQVGTVVSEIGSSGGFEAEFLGGTIQQNAASIRIGVEDGDDVAQLVADVRAEANDVFGEDNVVVSSGTLSSGAFGSFALVLSGDLEQLQEVNDQVLAALEDVDGLANPGSNLADESAYLRVDGETAVRYTAELETEDTLGVTEAAKQQVQDVVPDTITVGEGFETQQQTEGFAQALEAIAISIAAVYLVMIITFRSFLHPFTILFSLPLAVIGAAVALWVTNRVLGLSALVGMMMLVGIVVTNAIVLIDRVQTNRKKRGMTVREALLEGGQTRLRPILMTAIAAMMALMPLAIGLSEGAIVAAELGTVVIGGLFSSTLLTLLVVPVMYSLVERLSNRGRGEE